MATLNRTTNGKSWADIPTEELDEVDSVMLSEIEKIKDDQEFIESAEVSRRTRVVRAERKKKGDLHVRIAASLHEEIINAAIDEGISLNQYVVTALAYYAGVRERQTQS